MTHYFTDNRQLAHNRKEISFRFLGVSYTFITDSGVFAKDKVDTGSAILLKALVNEPLTGTLLDYGCGYGVLGIVLAKQFALEVTGVDVNERALSLTKENAEKNQVLIETILNSGSLLLNQRFSNIVMNPPIRAGKQIIYQMFAESYELLKENGTLYIVMRKQHGAESAIKELNKNYTNVEVIYREKGFLVIKSKKA